MNVAIVTDSTADIPSELAEKYHIQIVPAIIILPDGQVEDGKGMTRQEFYSQLPEMQVLPTTAAPSSGAFARLYDQLLQAGHPGIVSIHLAGKLSGMLNSAAIAAQPFGDAVHVVDSDQVSMGLGFQVMAAAEIARTGAPLPAILDRIESVRPRIRLYAMIDTLDYIRRSGRVSRLQAGLGSLLKVKIFLRVQDGQVMRVGEIRTRRRGLERLREILQGLGPLEALAILHTDAEEEARQFLAASDLELEGQALIIEATTVIGTHVGPHGIGFATVLKPRLAE